MIAAVARFRLDRDTHTYWYDDRKIPGTTGVLTFWKFIDITYYTQEARDIGTAVHLGTHFLDKGTLKWSSIKDPRILGRIMAYERFKAEMAFKPEGNEEAFAGLGGLYGCMIDRTGSMRGVRFCLVELKCGQKAKWHRLQTGAQQRALPTPGARRFVVYLEPGGTYSIEEHTDPNDGDIFTGLASGMNWAIANGYGPKGD